MEALPRPWPQQKDSGYPSPKCCWGLIGTISSSYHWGLASPGTARSSHLFSVTQLRRTQIIK